MVFKVIGNEVYEALKIELLSGSYPHGSKIDIGRMAEKLHTSATPIRESLMRLVGEQIVHLVPHAGFFTPSASDTKLRRLIEWSHYQLVPAIRAAGALQPSRPVKVEIDKRMDPVLNLEQTFLAIAGLSGNPELKLSIGRTNERLRQARKVAPWPTTETSAEATRIAERLVEGDYGQVGICVDAHHERLKAAVPKLVERLEAQDNN